MRNLLNAIQNTCIAISQKENGKYFAFFEYSGRVDEIHIRVSRRPTYDTFFNESVYLDSKNPKAELQKILDQLIKFHNE